MIKRVDSRGLRARRHHRIRAKLSGTAARPRISVFRSAGHIYAQIIDDTLGHTLAQASSLDEGIADVAPIMPAAAPALEATEKAPAKGDKGGKPAPAKGGKAVPDPKAKPAAPAEESKRMRLAHQVGTLLAQRALEKNIKQVVFDRGGYLYHGRIKALAQSARAAGLEF